MQVENREMLRLPLCALAMGLIKPRTKQGKRTTAPAPVVAPPPALDDSSSSSEDDSDVEEQRRLAGLLESARLAARARSSAPAEPELDDGLAANDELVRLSDSDDADALEPPRKRRKGCVRGEKTAAAHPRSDVLVRPVSLADLRSDQPVASPSRARPPDALEQSKWGTLPAKRVGKKERQKVRRLSSVRSTLRPSSLWAAECWDRAS